MAARTHLRRRHGRYYWRARVPLDLVPLVGRTELQRALNTADLATAKRRALECSLDAERLFTMLTKERLSAERITELVRGFLTAALEEAEAARRAGPALDPDEQRERADVLEILADDAKDALAEGETPKSIHEAAEALLLEQGFIVSRESDAYRALCRALLRASFELHRIEARRVRGDYTARPRDPLFTDAPQDGAGSNETAPTRRKGGPKLSTVTAKYIAERGGKWAAKTRLDYDSTFRLFTESAGEKPIGSYGRDDVRRFKEMLMTRPINAGRGSSTRTLAPKTVNKHLLSLASFFNWSETNGYTEKNPAKGLRLDDPRRPDEQRKAFSKAQLKTLFERPQEGPPSHRWVPLVALFSGMRLGEILQLSPADITEQDGVMVFRVMADDGKRLKTAAASRLVPVHPELERIGFLRFVETMKGSHLWPDYTNATGVDRYSKMFGRLLTRLGVKDTGLSFHSFRHTLTNSLKQAGVPEPIIAEIIGHANHSITTGRYGKVYEPKVLAEAIRKADFGLTLEPLA